MREQIIIEKAVGKNVKVTDAQIKAYFDKNHAAFDKPAQVRARHILVPNLQTAQKVEAELKSGARLRRARASNIRPIPAARTRAASSACSATGRWCRRSTRRRSRSRSASISPPVKSPFGYHIIQVEERKPPVEGDAGELAATRFADMLRQQQEAPLIPPFLQGLRSKANIDINDPRFKDALPAACRPAGAGAAGGAGAARTLPPAPPVERRRQK